MSSCSRLLVLSLCASGVLVVTASPAREAQSADPAVVSAIIARSESVFSGRIKYKIRDGFRGDKVEQQGEYDLTFSGSSFRLGFTCPASEIPVAPARQGGQKPQDQPSLTGDFQRFTTSLKGKSVEYTANPQPDGSVRHKARVGAEQPLHPKGLKAPPVFAGTFWFDNTKRFVDRSRARGVPLPPSKINGYSVVGIEWAVSASDMTEAFHSYDADTAAGGFLRVYASPELGYALPRVEYLNPKRETRVTFDAKGFVERGGTFIPRNCLMEYYPVSGLAFFQEYIITEVAAINQPLPEKTFVLELPLGTEVWDTQTGKTNIRFELKEETEIPDELIDIITVQRPRFWRSTPTTAVTIGVMAGCLLVAVAVLIRRLRSKRSPG